MQLRLIGIHALEGVVSSELFQQLDFDEQAQLIIPTLLFALMDSKTDIYAAPDRYAPPDAREGKEYRS